MMNYNKITMDKIAHDPQSVISEEVRCPTCNKRTFSYVKTTCEADLLQWQRFCQCTTCHFRANLTVARKHQRDSSESARTIEITIPQGD